MTTSLLPQAATPMKRSKLRRSVSDSLVVTERNLVAYLRIPDQLFFSSVQPIMFVLLFRFVFGGAIATPA